MSPASRPQWQVQALQRGGDGGGFGGEVLVVEAWRDLTLSLSFYLHSSLSL